MIRTKNSIFFAKGTIVHVLELQQGTCTLLIRVPGKLTANEAVQRRGGALTPKLLHGRRRKVPEAFGGRRWVRRGAGKRPRVARRERSRQLVARDVGRAFHLLLLRERKGEPCSLPLRFLPAE